MEQIQLILVGNSTVVNWFSYDNSASINSLAHYIIVEMGFTPTISGNQTICQGSNATLVASGAGSNGNYIWDNNLGAGNTQTVSPNSTTTYTVTATDVNGCSASASTTVNVTPSPQVSATSSTNFESPNVFIDFFGTSQNANQYLWDFDDGNTATTQNTTHAYTTTGSYQVTFTGYNGNCFDQDQISIMILDNNTSIHEFHDGPFVITPNPSIGNLVYNLKIMMLNPTILRFVTS